LLCDLDRAEGWTDRYGIIEQPDNDLDLDDRID